MEGQMGTLRAVQVGWEGATQHQGILVRVLVAGEATGGAARWSSRAHAGPMGRRATCTPARTRSSTSWRAG